MERILKELADRLTKTFQDRLVSVILYGSAAVGDRQEKYSDFNVFCVLKQLTPQELADSETVFRWWREHGNPAPLLMSEDEVGRSTDCFPIEFRDMKERRRVLAGADVVSDLVIGDYFYRAQVEHELRAKLLRLRQKAAGVMSDKNLLTRLLADSISTFCTLFRHSLVLAGAEPAFEKRQVVDLAAQRFGIDPAPFHSLLDLREQKTKPREIDPRKLLEQYLKEIYAVVDAVDRLEK
jgi:predicted nucleotidyltransferase